MKECLFMIIKIVGLATIALLPIIYVLFKDDEFEPYIAHIVLADGKEMFSGSNCIEPEDVQFHRNLHSPFIV